jgi:hypothetical protein
MDQKNYVMPDTFLFMGQEADDIFARIEAYALPAYGHGILI